MIQSKILFLDKVVTVVCLTLFLIVVIELARPALISVPAASPSDKAMEDLSRIEYPSVTAIKWHAHFILPGETLEQLFGKDWVAVARFNRLDRRHAYPGMTIKVPDNMADIRGYTPMPKFYEPAKRHSKYILVDISEQWLAAYERGKLVFSMPAATGKSGTETPTGIFNISARHIHHTSSLYKTQGEEAQYPMDNAMRFHIGKDNVSYWIHARDLPGRPASHGCIGLYDEAMQLRMFDYPAKPVLLDSKKLYAWAVGVADYGEDSGSAEELEGAPFVEVRGALPKYLPATPKKNRSK